MKTESWEMKVGPDSIRTLKGGIKHNWKPFTVLYIGILGLLSPTYYLAFRLSQPKTDVQAFLALPVFRIFVAGVTLIILLSLLYRAARDAYLFCSLSANKLTLHWEKGPFKAHVVLYDWIKSVSVQGNEISIRYIKNGSGIFGLESFLHFSKKSDEEVLKLASQLKKHTSH